MFLFPSIGRSQERRAVLSPHLVDECVPGLALSSPFFVVVSTGRVLDGLDEVSVIFVHPAINVVKEGVMVPRLLSVHQPQCKALRHPAHARAAAAIALAGVLALLPF